MAINLPNSLTTKVTKYYKDAIETWFPKLTTLPVDPEFSPFQDWRDAKRFKGLGLGSYSSVAANEFLDDRLSYFVKMEGIQQSVSTADHLFYLTKMLAVPESPEFTAYRLTELGGDTVAGSVISAVDNLLAIGGVVPGGALESMNLTSNELTLGQFPAGASKQDKEKIFNDKIFGNIDQHYNKIQKSGNLDAITKSILRAWWTEKKGSLSEPYLLIAGDISGVKSLNDLDTAKIQIRGAQGGAVGRLYDTFFKTIAKPDDNIASGVLDALGFSAYLKEHADQWGGVGAVDRTLQGLESAAKTDPTAFKDIAVSSLDLPEELTEKDLNNLNQCALVTALIHDAKPWAFRKYINDKAYSSPLSQGKAGTNRIYPVQIDNYNPNKLVNNCVIHKKVKNMFNTTDTKTPHNMVKGVFWVFEVGEGEDRVLREAELSTNSTVHKKKINSIFQNMMNSPDGSDSLKFETLDRIKDSSYYFLENTKINFDGTNPSTARSDVKVEMTWKLGSLEGLGSTMAILGTADKLDMDTEITIKDLITLPITKKPNASDGPGQFITNQYSPNYSRLRLKVAPFGDKDGNHQEDCMILDLAIIDHQINRSSETGETTLTINYRGYFEATLNMPFNDALASPETIKSRETAQQTALDKLLTNNCEPELVREALRLERESYKEESSSPSAGTILLRMQKRDLIHSYELDKTKLAGGIFGNVLDGRQMYVKHVTPHAVKSLVDADKKILAELKQDKKVVGGQAEYDVEVDAQELIATTVGATMVGGVFAGAATLLASDSLMGELSDDDLTRWFVLHRLDKKFFFLGDLMWTLLDCLYDGDTDGHRLALKNLNLRFVMGTIYVPNPKNLGGPPTAINPISIPVDLKFFVQWFNATIVNKGITNYPVGTFIRDLIERMVNDVIYDTCFSLLLPDENPPLLRSRTFVTSDTKWFKKTNGWFNPKSPFDVGATDILFPKRFISSKTSSDNTWSQEITSKNYCVIFQQSPSYKRQLAAEKNGFLRDDEYTPTIYYGAKNKNYNFLSDVSFSKTNSPFLREARFFNTDNGGLSLLSNVYDLSFSFKRRKANTMFYPGCIINFVLLDWGKRWVDEPPWIDDGQGNITHYFGSGSLGDSDPHTEGTMSNIMGMGGYFIIKSVEYNLGQTPGEFEINITTKFLGTDGKKQLNRTADEIRNLEHSEKCAVIFNNTAERYNKLMAVSGSTGGPTVIYLDVEAEGTRVSELTGGETISSSGPAPSAMESLVLNEPEDLNKAPGANK